MTTSFIRHWRAVVFFLATLILYVVYSAKPIPVDDHLSQLILHSAATLCVVAFVHLLDRMWLAKDILHDVQGTKDELSKKIGLIVEASASLQAMNESGIIRIYPSRSMAANDMSKDMLAPGVTSIMLAGVSLNDFVVSGRRESPLRSAWQEIEARIKGDYPNSDHTHVEIRLLIVDPECLGAQLRARAETQGHNTEPERLSADVNEVAKALLALKREADKNHQKCRITLDCRLYRTAPTLFVLRTDFACYVEPYHFWHSRDDRTPIPILKYRRVHEASETIYDVHSEMKHHFEWIWQKASISLEEFVDQGIIGTDKGIRQLGTVNVFTDSQVAWTRILWLLTHAQRTVDIQGISLHSFFGVEGLADIVWKLVEDGKVDVRVLVLSRDCDQALYRAYRENRLHRPEVSFEKYKTTGLHQNSQLYKQTTETIEAIQTKVKAISTLKSGNDQGAWRCRLELREYDSAAACFMLRIDDAVLVEQYHYGKVRRGVPTILGKDMPLCEYTVSEQDLYPSIPHRTPYNLLVDHFNFVWEHALVPNVDTTSSVGEQQAPGA